jgi:tetratricopeptide (TPR) repeat protein
MLISNNANYFSGAAYFRKDEYDTAIVDLTQAISLNPNNANHYYWRGRKRKGTRHQGIPTAPV